MHRRLSDYREAYRVMQPRGPYYVAASILSLVIFILIVINISDAALPGYLAATALLLALYLGNYGYCIYFKLPERAFKAHEKHEPISYTFGEEGLAMSTAVGSSRTSWKAFTRFNETAETFVIVYPNTLFYVVPKRDVPADRLDDLRSLLKRKFALQTSRS
ncbi:MAG TPA: YcxB family protein [Verrucomicrobiae bacterium]|nr:YcxB family protein [Verrucomicrobiae bacterium]